MQNKGLVVWDYIWEVETGGLQVQDLSKLLNEFKDSLGKFSLSCKTKNCLPLAPRTARFNTVAHISCCPKHTY